MRAKGQFAAAGDRRVDRVGPQQQTRRRRAPTSTARPDARVGRSGSRQAAVRGEVTPPASPTARSSTSIARPRGRPVHDHRGTGTMLTYHGNKKACHGRRSSTALRRASIRSSRRSARSSSRVATGATRSTDMEGSGRRAACRRASSRTSTAARRRRQEVRRRQARDGGDLPCGQGRRPVRRVRDGKPAISGQYDADRKHGTWTTTNRGGRRRVDGRPTTTASSRVRGATGGRLGDRGR